MSANAGHPDAVTTGPEGFGRICEELAQADPAIAAALAEHGPPTYWTRPPGFATLALFILEQQVSLASAEATFRRLTDAEGRLTTEHLLGLEDLRALGVSRQKERYLRALAVAVSDGDLDLEGLAGLSDAAVRAALTALPGIGLWTADVYLLAVLQRPDLWPVGDRALQVAAAEALSLPAAPGAVELERIGERWRPQRSSAARILWHGYLRRRGRVETPGDLLTPQGVRAPPSR